MASNIEEVAKAAGVSIATVSRVLSDKPHVSEPTRQRVLAAVEQLGYRPSRVAQSLRSQQTQIIGLIISDIQNPFFTALVRAVEDYAHDHGYTLLLCNSDEDPDKELLYINLMMAENVAGVIISPTSGVEAAYKQLAQTNIAIVSIDRRMAHIDVDTVITENVNASYKLVSHLIQNNHRRIGAVFGTSTISTQIERQQGYEQALADHQIPFLPELVLSGKAKTETGYQMAQQLLALPNPPTALFTGNNQITIGALRAIHEAGLAIPHDVAIAVYDEMDWMFVMNPPLTVATQPVYEMGQRAAELLLKRIANPERPITEIVLTPQVFLRQSSMAQQMNPEQIKYSDDPIMNNAIKHALENDSVIDITTIGRQSGKPRRIEMWHRQVEGRTYITGTPGKRDWYANMLEQPDFTFHLKESIELDLLATARPITNPDERRQVLAAPSMKWYHEQVDSLDDLVADSPLVEVSFNEVV